jgi:hypothetical protein
MPTEYDIILKHSSAGWLGILMIDGKEKYRTGNHKTGPVAALTAVQFWMQSNL